MKTRDNGLMIMRRFSTTVKISKQENVLETTFW